MVDGENKVNQKYFKSYKAAVLVSAIAFLAGCEPGTVDTSTPTKEFTNAGGTDVYAVCLDGTQYWKYRSSITPRYDNKQQLMACAIERTKESITP
jgi:hypothetical protein